MGSMNSGKKQQTILHSAPFKELMRQCVTSISAVWHSEEWDSEMAAILLLLYLLPPTVKGKKSGKMSVSEATQRLIKFMKVFS